ncbi:MAG: hypothetical protein KatS3mg102_2020 [Planctomycetota bacterium]|nr:MAG: hypothetical protein KatS3mg102_2020 [Planctomycetota bacterium]
MERIGFLRQRGAALLAWCWLCGWLVGCAHAPPRLEIERSGYYLHGWYLGSRHNVKAFVRRLRFVPEMRGSVVAEISLLNEQRQPLTLELAYSKLTVAEREILAEEAPATELEPGKLGNYTLRFRTYLRAEQVRPGMALQLQLAGITDAERRQISFRVPLSFVQPEAEPPPGED